MLLPSALPCDGNQDIFAQRRRPLLRRFMPFSSTSLTSTNILPTLSILPSSSILPPVVDATCASGLPSPLLSPASISSGIQSTCRALQSLLGVTPSEKATKPARRNQIPSPPADLPKALPLQNHRITKHSSPVRPSLPSRGQNKRTRDEYETYHLNTAMEIDNQNSSEYISHGYGYSFDSGYAGSTLSSPDIESANEKCFSTPKRRRRLPGPANLPFGLDRRDFADLENPGNEAITSPQSDKVFESLSSPSTPTSHDEDEIEEWWTPVDDAQLVTIVLEKMNLSRRDWEECAKVLGAEGEGGSLGKRWKWLMEEGKIGLKMGAGEAGRFEGRRARRRQARGDVRKMF